VFRLRLRCNVLILCLLVGCSLFHVVVDTDDISTKIIRYLTADKGFWKDCDLSGPGGGHKSCSIC
jgi:hypothetical protein